MQTTDYQIIESEELEAPAEVELDVYCWRMEQLLESGYLAFPAAELAANREVDLHLACELLERGCDPQTAYRIMA